MQVSLMLLALVHALLVPPTQRASAQEGRRDAKGEKIKLKDESGIERKLYDRYGYRFENSVSTKQSGRNKTKTAGQAANPRPGTVVRGGAGIELVYVPAGSFMMGWAKGRSHQHPVHRVTINNLFYMGRYEVTQAQWRRVMRKDPPEAVDERSFATFKACDNCPVGDVSWNDAQAFIKKLNAMKDGFIYRLPSEAEWEYAARAGTTTEYAFGDSLDSTQANFKGNCPHYGARGVDRDEMTPVGSFQPNAWGLYDMHGNAEEWVQDVKHDNYDGAPSDGSAWLSDGDSKSRVVRGGSYNSCAPSLCSGARRFQGAEFPNLDNGFRVIAVPRQ